MTLSALRAGSATGFHFGTKAETLERLAGRLSRATLCRQLVVTTDEWRVAPDDVAERVAGHFAGVPLVVRSSMDGEDGLEQSQAGAFDSVADVAPEPAAIDAAIARVVASYGEKAAGQQVLIQEMVRDVVLSGVILTRDLDTGAPYYVINYDDFSGRTDTVTGGAISKIVQVQRDRPEALRSSRMRRLIDIVREIEHVTGNTELDIEFCARADMAVYVLQVRPLAARRGWDAPADSDVYAALDEARQRVAAMMRPRPGIAGLRTVLGVMPDWNPAEMIGRTPRRLATSLYRRLITDDVWARARSAMGYRAVAAPLLVTLSERPYIDVRLSLNSFLPAETGDGLAGRLVDWQLDRLAGAPQHHDKVEFAIAATCHDPSFAGYAAELRAAGFSRDDITGLEDGLHRITARALGAGSAGIQAIAAQPERILAASPADAADPLDAAETLLDRTAADGTFPFSILARHAFIAMSFLKGLVAKGALGEDDASRFLMSVHTVAADLLDDMIALRENRLDRASFLETYGHLRPGTYDIQAWRYDERPALYLDDDHGAPPAAGRTPFALPAPQNREIGKVLSALGYDLSADALFDYMAAAIAARERAKFAFTRGLSDALRRISVWGEGEGLSREDLANLAIGDILRHRAEPERLRDLADEGRAAHRLSRATLLHHFITAPEDIDVVYPARGEPTYIGNASVIARPSLVTSAAHGSLDGAIVMIESADPGYDWIFTHPIAGLVTQYGGANSHMAIRCAEFGLPAAIGCGERSFEALKGAARVELDCRARRLAAH